MKKSTFFNINLLFIFCCFTNFLIAQTVTVTGQILDQKSNDPLISATLQAGNLGTTTDLE